MTKAAFTAIDREAISRRIPVIQTDSGGTVEHPMADPARLIPIGAPASRMIADLEQGAR